jgi:hypothetical protein
MKYKIVALTATIVALTTTPVLADNVKGNVTDVYKNVTRQIPYTQQVCQLIDVPIYGTSGADVLGGMIIGGLLGKGVTGKDNGAAAGAILGGVIAADKKQGQQVIVGYRQEQRCNTVTQYDTTTEQVYSHSTITFYEDGRNYTLKFQK